MSSNSSSRPGELSGISVKELEPENINLDVAVENLEKTFISRALDQTHWNRSKAAMLLGISRRCLFRKMKIFGMM